jgi:putative endonuclease
MRKTYHVYILSNVSRMLYIGITSNLDFRVFQHRNKLLKGFTQAYNLFKLVYFEGFDDVHLAIKREKQLKGWLRSKKIALIESVNPNWDDLAASGLARAVAKKDVSNKPSHESHKSLRNSEKPLSS